MSTDLKRPTLIATKELLSPLGYHKAANLFSRSSEDVVHLVEIQGSRQSTSAEVQFTVNVGVFVPALVYADVRETTRPSIPLAHWRKRIGSLSPENEDLWWKVSTEAQAIAAARDVATRIRSFALPSLAELPDLKSLASLWRSGTSPGITEQQCEEFLVRLGRSRAAAQNAV